MLSFTTIVSQEFPSLIIIFWLSPRFFPFFSFTDLSLISPDMVPYIYLDICPEHPFNDKSALSSQDVIRAFILLVLLVVVDFICDYYFMDWPKSTELLPAKVWLNLPCFFMINNPGGRSHRSKNSCTLPGPDRSDTSGRLCLPER